MVIQNFSIMSSWQCDTDNIFKGIKQEQTRPQAAFDIHFSDCRMIEP